MRTATCTLPFPLQSRAQHTLAGTGGGVAWPQALTFAFFLRPQAGTSRQRGFRPPHAWARNVVAEAGVRLQHATSLRGPARDTVRTSLQVWGWRKIRRGVSRGGSRRPLGIVQGLAGQTGAWASVRNGTSWRWQPSGSFGGGGAGVPWVPRLYVRRDLGSRARVWI